MHDIKKDRKIIFLIAFSLTLLGLLMIYEASSIYAFKLYQDSAYFFKKQLFYFLLSLLLFFSLLPMDLNFFRKHSDKILIFNILLLSLVLLFGKRIGGARRWVSFLGVNFQPSELLKVSFLIYCAHYFERKGALLRSFKQGFCPLVFITAICVFLIIVEPDFGTAVFWMFWLFLMLFILGAKKRHLFSLFASTIVVGAIFVTLYPYRFSRITTYLNPWQDPKGSGFQLIQSQIAYGGGGIFGLGLGESKQKFLFLPAAHTDFIFSIIGEEFGFIGSSAVLLVLFIFFLKIFKLSNSLSDPFRKNICLGGALIFGLEIVINIGVTCGVFPTKGLPLPFISYGGSNLVVHYLLLGLLFNASQDEKSIVSYG